jgi:hypothetical protein
MRFLANKNNLRELLNAAPIAPLVVAIIIWLGIGSACLFWPNRVQSLFVRSFARLPSWYLKYWPFAAWTKEWMTSPSYIWYLRGVGIFSIAVGSFLLFIAAVR